MKDGMLSKRELHQLGSVYATLAELGRKAAQTPMSKNAECLLDDLCTARNKVGNLLRWQDHAGVWQQVKGGGK